MLQSRSTFLAFALTVAALLVAGCSVQTSKNKEGNNQNVTITSPMGGLKVRTEGVDAKDTGLSIYPGAKEKPSTGDDKKQANVNIDTPWFGVKVVAVTMLSEDAPDKIWDFYKKDMSQYGHVLECKKGSPDMDIKKSDKNTLTCQDEKDHNHHGVQIRTSDTELKVGTEEKQRVVAVKPNGSGTEFTLVYVQTHGGTRESI